MMIIDSVCLGVFGCEDGFFAYGTSKPYYLLDNIRSPILSPPANIVKPSAKGEVSAVPHRIGLRVIS
jgi:hypothetical protein